MRRTGSDRVGLPNGLRSLLRRPLQERDGACAGEDRAERLRRVANDPGLADTLNNLAGALDALGRGDEAEAVYAEALAAYRASGRREDEALVLSNLAALAIGRGEPGRALRWIAEAETVARSTDEPWAAEELAVAHENVASGEPFRTAPQEAKDFVGRYLMNLARGHSMPR